MRLADKIRGTGFQTAALTMLLVMLSMTILGAVLYGYVNQVLEQRVRDRLVDELRSVLAARGAAEPELLAGEVARRTTAGYGRRFAYRLIATDGTQLAGDDWLQADTTGWKKQAIPPHGKSPFASGEVLVLTASIDQRYLLSIGRDIHWIGEVDRELLVILLWSLLGALALAGLTAFVVNRLVAHRIDVVSRTAATIMDGNLAQRVPLTGASDDFDRLAQTLNAMLDRIAELMESVQQVTNDIAHDLRTPLSRLRQGLEQARLTASTPTEHQKAIDRTLAEADNLLSTFTALLRIAQIESGARRAAFKNVDLSSTVQAVCEAYQPSAEDADHTLMSDIAEGATIRGDKDLLVQLMANLIENGLSHTPAGTRIQISVQRRGRRIEVSVADSGPGVPEREREAIFRRFYRRESSRTTPGTGLGLSLVAAIARLHGAHLEVGDNAPGLRVSLSFDPNAGS